MAFGIPILHRLLELPNQFKKERYLKALILTPTRELAVQISDHLNQIAKFTDLKVKTFLVKFLNYLFYFNLNRLFTLLEVWLNKSNNALLNLNLMF